MPTNLPSVDRNNLSTDHEWLLDIHQFIVEMKSEFKMMLSNPSKKIHTPWRATTNRMQRLYVAIENAMIAMELIVLYIRKFYAPAKCSLGL